jgi:hypothetical protein
MGIIHFMDRCAGDTTSWIYSGYIGIIETYGIFGESLKT